MADMLIGGGAGSYTLHGGAGVDTAKFAGNQGDYVIDAAPDHVHADAEEGGRGERNVVGRSRE